MSGANESPLLPRIGASFALALLSATASAPVAAQLTFWQPSSDTEYRAQVIGSAATMDGVEDRFERTARHAYLAWDKGPDSTEAAQLQGYDAVRSLLWSFELRHEAKPVQDCTLALVGQGQERVLALSARIASSPERSRLLALAEAKAPYEYAQMLANWPNPTDVERVVGAVLAISQSAQKEDSEPVVVAALSYYLAVGSDGACPATPRLRLMVESPPPAKR